MPEHEYDDLLARVRGATDAVSARPDAVTAVRGGVAARQRTRRRAAGALAVAAVVAVVGGGLLVDRATSPDTPAASPTDDASDPPSAIEGDLYRPAGFFEDVVGGRAAPREIRYRLAKGAKFVAELDWWPADRSDPPYLAGIGLERADAPPAAACAALPPLGSCEDRGAGDVAQPFEARAGDVRLDPLNRLAPLDAPPDAAVRGVTYLRADGWVVTVLVCSCSADGSTTGGAPPVTLDRLEQVAGSDTWVRAD